MRALVAILVTAVLASCSYETPIRRVSFHVRAAGPVRDPSGPPVFTTPLGWTVTLTSAQVSIGPVYFYNAMPTAGTSTNQGIVVAQVLEVFSVDVLNPEPETIPAGGNGLNEPVMSAIVRLNEEQAGPIADVAGAGVAVAHVSGVAQQGSTVIPFDGTLRLPMGGTVSAYQQFTEHQVTQIPASFSADEGGTLTIRIDPAHWFDRVPFDQLCASPPCDLASNAATAQLESGVASASAFTFEWVAP